MAQDEMTLAAGNRPIFPIILFSASLRFTPSGLARKFVPDEFFIK